MLSIKRLKIAAEGVVQGVGFRPFVYNLATSMELKGWVKNTPRGVIIEAEGDEQILNKFIPLVTVQAPPLAIIERTSTEWLNPIGYNDFVIAQSDENDHRFTLISPDTATCGQCLAELNDPGNRRYRYPFINCTHCGPRFTIIKDVPYDRPYTTMAGFAMCSCCLEEYYDPGDRRFHAQPNACAKCGPRVMLLDNRSQVISAPDPVIKGVELLKSGHILAVKGLGGYHLVCDALNTTVVKQLRDKKNREAKPFGVMMADIETVKKHCLVSREEEKLLTDNSRPIVLLKKKAASKVASAVAPGNSWLGVMLPYTPLHHLLFIDGPQVLVMTSGNSSGESIEYIDQGALNNLKGIAGYFLTHNRDIHIPTDDSVTRIFRGNEMIIRRSRGYVPLPLKMPFEASGILATGGGIKNTLCLSKGSMAFLSQHTGDLEYLSNMEAFKQGIAHLQGMFDINLRTVAYDLHPGYMSSKYAQEMPGLDKIPVQHHHAHIASCMAEHQLVEDVIGVAFDGSGYGTDDCIWGGEFFTGSYHSFTRMAHLAYVPLPGGDMAVKQPWRMAISYLVTLNIDSSKIIFKDLPQSKVQGVTELLQHYPKNILTSSAGRLFDGVAALLGLCREISYEGQAAVELEHLAAETHWRESYNYLIDRDITPWQIHFGDMFRGILQDLQFKQPLPYIAAKFHRTVAEMIEITCIGISNETGLKTVVLSGGVFQNMLLLQQTVDLLENSGFRVYTHSKVPPNDGGICLGQAAMAGWLMKQRGEI